MKVYDPTYKKYFWFNNQSRISSWQRPKRVPVWFPKDLRAAAQITKVINGFIHRCRV